VEGFEGHGVTRHGRPTKETAASTAMKIGLALSGGGFRATLYHLGLLRFLRDAGILSQVTHIASVSGGSIMAAHLALHWNLYTGSPEEFDKAAAHLLDFTRLDVRNRIVRRFPLGLFLRWPRFLLGLSNRPLTRTGLLERQYERHLYGDKSLFELPESPELHILATNLSEGCLCSFNRDGLWMMEQKAGNAQIKRVRVGLMTVPMAVAASSAFPGFFPPLVLTGRDVGASGGEFGHQAYTDGGVFDNLGVRMFRWLTPLLTGEKALDGVLVSDVGKPFEIQVNRRAGGLISTAMRASDILMDRVWLLECENFQDTFGFVFARITDVVTPREDATALHPEVQRQTANVRTDLDAFSELEISCLVRHGYCTGRKACRSRPDLFGTELPTTGPWDPIPPARITSTPASASKPDGMIQDAAPATLQARQMQGSATRRIWSNLFRIRDWTSYIYVPLLFLLLFLLPYSIVRSYVNSQRVDHLVEALALSSPQIDILSQLIAGPMRPFQGEPFEEVQSLDPPNYKGFTVLQDSSILDLRPWRPSDATTFMYGSRRLKVLKDPEKIGNEMFRVVALTTDPEAKFRFPSSQFQPKLRRLVHPSAQKASCDFEVSVDLSKSPGGQMVDLIYEHYSRGVSVQQRETSTTVTFRTDVDALELTRWFLLPQGEQYKSYQILRYETGKPETTVLVKEFTDYMVDDASIIAFKLALVKAGHTYEVTWSHK
jgi:predicted acylesterase/phospholipase RssA